MSTYNHGICGLDDDDDAMTMMSLLDKNTSTPKVQYVYLALTSNSFKIFR